jgi:hypothetical protein
MPYVYDIARKIQGRRISARFYTEKQAIRAGALDIPRYHQLDHHSCGFLAALAVVRCFNLKPRMEDVLAASMPAPSRGCDQNQMIRALKRLGITAAYRQWLGWPQIARELAERRPVIVTITQA